MGIPYMTNKIKNKTKQKKQVSLATPKPKKKATPFADAGDIVGKQLAGMFNMPFLRSASRFLGSGIGHIFGSGDYQMVGPTPEYNVLTNDRQIPKFDSSDRTNIVCHREYLGTITGTSAFTNRGFRLNPGDDKTFPWLSTIATSFQEYKFHGLIFEFRSLLTDYVPNGTPGVTIMATNYNSARPLYSSKVAMENSEYAVSTKPTVNMVHAVECKPSETVLDKLYVRDSQPTTEDAKFYDLGLTQLATQGNPASTIGELWVSYCVEFFKPKLSDDIVGDVRSAFLTRDTITALQPLGANLVGSAGDLSVSSGPTGLRWAALPGASYQVTIGWLGGTATAPTVNTFTNCSAYFSSTGSVTTTSPNNAWIILKANPDVGVGDSIGLDFAITGTFSSVASVVIVVSEVSSAIIV